MPRNKLLTVQEATLREPTIIDIASSVDATLSDERSPYYERTELTFKVKSTSKFDKVTYTHLGFHAHSSSKRAIKPYENGYIYIGALMPNVDAQTAIAPFRLYLENIGDSFLGIHIRMQGGVQRCKVTILQDHKYQTKAPKEIDDFIEYEGIWYCTTIISCLQTVRIEELK